MKRFSILLILTILAPAWAFAGGWTQKKGGYYAKLSLNNFSTREQFNLRGHREPLNTQFSLRDAKFTDTNQPKRSDRQPGFHALVGRLDLQPVAGDAGQPRSVDGHRRKKHGGGPCGLLRPGVQNVVKIFSRL